MPDISEFINNLRIFPHNPPATVVFFTISIIVFLLFFVTYYVKVIKPERGTTEWIDMELGKTGLTFLNHRHPMTRKDIAPLLIITVAFLFLALFNLGSTNTVDVLREIAQPSGNRKPMENLYFDEIYFVTTAVEHINSIWPWEQTHPPLGKEIIAASILTFGMSPLGWRLIGAVCGVLMLVVIYIFIKNMFGKTVIATCATLLLGFDFMRFVQTRIATIDTYVVLFILLAFFFMYRHITTDKDADFRKSLAPLALSGLFFGLSVSVKWTGFYAGAGLLAIYVIRLVQLGKYYKKREWGGFGAYLAKTLLFSVLFFVIVPALIYYLTYIPYGLAVGLSLRDGMLWDPWFVDRIVWGNQVYMFNYHSELVADHAFSSAWWQWIFNIRPILYVNTHIGDTVRATYGAYGNPVVWWGGLIAMFVMLIRVFSHRDGKALFILIGYLSQLLPWTVVTRILFAYHYFPSALFIILALAHMFNTIMERDKPSRQFYVYGFTALTGMVFAMFYPSLSGMYMPHWYYQYFVRWLYSWPF